MVNNFYDQTMTITDIFDKDLTFHVTDSLRAVLETTAPVSTLSKGLSQQSKKKDSQDMQTKCFSLFK